MLHKNTMCVKNQGQVGSKDQPIMLNFLLITLCCSTHKFDPLYAES